MSVFSLGYLELDANGTRGPREDAHLSAQRKAAHLTGRLSLLRVKPPRQPQSSLSQHITRGCFWSMGSRTAQDRIAAVVSLHAMGARGSLLGKTCFQQFSAFLFEKGQS